MKLRLLSLFVSILVAALCSSRVLYAEKSAEEQLEEINRLPAAERAKALADGAKKEGEMLWYSTMNRENSAELSQAFEKDHPYVSVKILSGSAVNTMTRITSEFRARTYLFDVTHIRGLFLSALRKASMIARYRAPLHQLMTEQIRVHDLDLDEILAQAVPDNLSQAVRENGHSLLPNLQQAVGAFEQS